MTNEPSKNVRDILERALDLPTDAMPANFKDAFLNGDRYYFTGRPCRNGHISPRAVSQPRPYICVQCGLDGFE